MSLKKFPSKGTAVLQDKCVQKNRRLYNWYEIFMKVYGGRHSGVSYLTGIPSQSRSTTLNSSAWWSLPRFIFVAHHFQSLLPRLSQLPKKVIALYTDDIANPQMSVFTPALVLHLEATINWEQIGNYVFFQKSSNNSSKTPCQ